MTLVILYGPPAVGKLTVGTELAKLTGFKLFHNHLTYAPIAALFGDQPHEKAKELRSKMRHDLLEAAAEHGVPGVIYTYLYYQREDDPKLQAIIESVHRHGGTVVFVQLTTDRATIEARISHKHRAAMGKIHTGELLDIVAAKHELFSPVPFEPNFVVDTTHTPPAEAARLIQEHYQLPSILDCHRSASGPEV